ncbi:MAG: tyrosine recombinase [Prevotella sp.]|nr:tyrosine recombinase [Prevotella sp.]MDY5546810.1 site-specific tyrosine recombinase/integron integrase [Prevotella sp.]
MDKENLTNPELMRRYMRYLKLERNFSQNTLEAYHHDVELLFLFLKTRQIKAEDAKLEDLEAFASWVMDDGDVGMTSLARILSGVKSLFRFMTLDGIIPADPSELLDSPQRGQHLPEVLSPEEIDLMENSFDMSKPESQRNKAIIETLFSCGLRVSELVNLKWSDIYAEEEFIRVRGKGSKERLVPISRRALEEINKWNLDRNTLKIKPGEQDFVFLNRRGAHLTRTMILIMIKRAATDAGIKKTVSPHTLRHSFATALLKGGADLRAIQEMLGHESIGTTEIYTHLETSDLRREILEHHPRNIKRQDSEQ